MDLLVSLKELPLPRPAPGIIIRRADLNDALALKDWIEYHFDADWASEATIGFSHKPITLFIALKDKAIVGFIAYECTAPSFIGPLGVTVPGHGIGKALLLGALHNLSNMGYRYGIIHDVGDSIGFYSHVLGDRVMEIII